MLIPARVISLVRSPDRRRLVSEQFNAAGIPFSFFDAIDGKSVPQTVLDVMQSCHMRGSYQGMLARDEIATAASHRSVLQEVAAGPDPFVAIFEDDVLLTENTSLFLRSKTLHALPPFDLIKLANKMHLHRLCMPIAKFEGIKVVAPLRAGFLTTCYVVSREGADKFARGLVPLKSPVDNMLRDANIYGLRLLETSPAVVRPSPSLPSLMSMRSQDRSRQRRTLAAWVHKRRFLFERRLRALGSFASAWGLQSIFRIRPMKMMKS